MCHIDHSVIVVGAGDFGYACRLTAHILMCSDDASLDHKQIKNNIFFYFYSFWSLKLHLFWVNITPTIEICGDLKH